MRIIIAFIIIVSFIGCSNNQNTLAIKQLENSLETNNKIIRQDIENIIRKIKFDIDKPEYRDKAKPLYERLVLCDKYSIEIIEEIKNAKKQNDYKIENLKKELASYLTKVKNIDTTLYQINISKQIELNQFEKILDSFNISNSILPYTLTFLKNELNKFELFYVTTSQNQLAVCCDLVYDHYWAIASQNTTHLNTNEKLTITAGVGCFTNQIKTKVYIDGKNIETNQEGVAEYKTIATGKKGTYSKQVVIEFIRPCDTISLKRVEKEIKYTID